MFPLSRLVRTLFSSPANFPTEDEHKLARILQLPAQELPTLRMGRCYHYRPFSIAKHDGRERRILAPSPALKELQRRLLHNYLATLPVHPAATAFVSNASIVTNAQRHAGQALIATLDLADFFESTSADRVRTFFLKQGWRGQALGCLMRLCVYKNGLPQGAPTSPALSNLVNLDLDKALHMLAHRSGAIYTRYGDDLTFSWRNNDLPAYFETAARQELLRAGYQVQPRKDWQVYTASQEPQITGLILGQDGRVRVPARLWWHVLKLCWLAWWQRDNAILRAQLQGYQGFLKSLE
jgi:hypothetical protein